MYLYEKMVIENKEIPIDDGKSLGNFEGLYDNGVILINKNLSETRKAEVLYEELAHHNLKIMHVDTALSQLFHYVKL